MLKPIRYIPETRLAPLLEEPSAARDTWCSSSMSTGLSRAGDTGGCHGDPAGREILDGSIQSPTCRSSACSGEGPSAVDGSQAGRAAGILIEPERRSAPDQHDRAAPEPAATRVAEFGENPLSRGLDAVADLQHAELHPG